MAEPIRVYEEEGRSPRFQQGDAGAARAAVSRAVSERAGSLGMQAEAQRQIARVLPQMAETVQRQVEPMAEWYGQTAKLPELRDGEGKLIPQEQTYNWSIAGKIYEERKEKAWEQEAEQDYREESNRANIQYKDDPDGFRDHMEAYRDGLVAKAPPGSQDRLDGLFRRDTEARGYSLDQVRRRNAEQRATAAIGQNLDFDQKEHRDLILRAAHQFEGLDEQGNRQVAPEFAENFQRAFSRLDAEVQQDPHMAEIKKQQLANGINQNAFQSMYWRIGVQWGRSGINTLDLTRNLRALEESIKKDEISIAGFPGKWQDGASEVFWSDLDTATQSAIDSNMRASMTRLVNDRKADIDMEDEDYFRAVLNDDFETYTAGDVNLPEDWIGVISESAQEHGIDPMLVFKNIDVESGGNPGAVSPENTRGRGTAKGLGQMLDSTWSDETLQRKAGFHTVRPDRNNPEHQLRMSVAYMGTLKDQILEKAPNLANDPIGLAGMIVGTYYAGPGIIDLMLNHEGFVPSDPNTYPPYNEDKPGQPTLAEHVGKVLEPYMAARGGAQAMWVKTTRDIEARFGDDPVRANQLIDKLITAQTNASSRRAYQADLTYTPPLFDLSSSQSYWNATWLRNSQTAPPEQWAPQLYQQMSETITSGSAEENARRATLQDTYHRAASTGKTKTQAELRRWFAGRAYGGWNTGDAEKANGLLEGGSIPAPYAEYARRVEVDGVGPATQFMKERYDKVMAQGNRNGGFPLEFADFAATGMEAMLRGQMSPEQAQGFANVIGSYIGGGGIGPAAYDPTNPRTGEINRKTLNNLGKMIGSSNEEFPESTGKMLLQHIARNAGRVGDADFMQELRAIETGAYTPESWAKQDPEGKKAIEDAFNERKEAGLHDLQDRWYQAIPDLEHIHPEVEGIIVRHAAMFMDIHSLDNAHLALDRAFEYVVNRGIVGSDKITYSEELARNPDLVPGSVRAVRMPVALNVPEAAITEWTEYEAMPEGVTAKVGTEDLDIRLGTIQGATNAHLDDMVANGALTREYRDSIDVAKEIHQGKIQFDPVARVNIDGNTPSLVVRIMREEARPGGMFGEEREEGEWRQVAIVDLTEMSQVARSSAYIDAYQNAKEVAGTTRGFFESGWFGRIRKGAYWRDRADIFKGSRAAPQTVELQKRLSREQKEEIGGGLHPQARTFMGLERRFRIRAGEGIPTPPPAYAEDEGIAP